MKKKWIKKAFAGVLTATMVCSSAMSTFASAAPDGSTKAEDLSKATSLTQEWSTWQSKWNNSVSKDWTQISLTPGSDATQLNFAWYSKKTDGTVNAPRLKIGEGRKMKNSVVYTATQTEVKGEEDKEGNTYLSNKVTAKGLKENTTYYYSYEKEDGTFTSPQPYNVRSTDNFSFIYVGDPQIGSSNGLKGKDTPEFYQAQSDAVMSDSFNWNTTLNSAMDKTGNNASFVVSAGDQIQTTKKKSIGSTTEKKNANSEIEYSGYLSPDVLKSLPVATTVGNHDADNENYTYHFNTPNNSQLGSNGIVGGDYYFSYGDVLFMMLNTQDTNVTEHKQFIEEAVSANPESKWRVVSLHQDIYGSAEHSNEPEIVNLRYSLTPYFEENGVDIVLTGHDHAYSRSKILKGGVATEISSAYTDDEFDEQLEKDLDYSGEGTLFEAPKNISDNTTDEAEKKYLAYLNSIMDANAVEEIVTENDTVMNPDGILYMTASSSSGSKYYDLVPRTQTYIANRWQEDVPTYSVIDVTENTLTINTYRTDTDEKIDSSFTIVKGDADKAELKEAVADANTVIKTNYTTSSYSVFEQAVNGAKAVIANAKAPKSEIANALKGLVTAKAGLVEKTNVNKLTVSSIKTQTYSGKYIKPTVTVKNGSKVLKNGTDYTVSYSGNRNIGTATVIVTGTGDYTGVKKATFTIAPAKTAVTVKSKKAKTANVTVTKVAGSVTGYQIVYASNSSFKNAVTKNVKTLNYTVTKLKSKSTLYVKVRAYKTVLGKNIYGSYSATAKTKIK
ncbi:MAG: metallophosphoesterase [Ruminococcus sp.]